MSNIKKVLTIRIISLLLSLGMALPANAYPLPKQEPHSLRVPVGSPELRERQQEAQRRIFLDEHGLLRFLGAQEALSFLVTADSISSFRTGRPIAADRARELILEGRASIAEASAGIERRVEESWSDETSALSDIKKRLDGLLEEIADDYSLVVIAPHNLADVPIDGDSFTFAAATYRRLVSQAQKAGREVEFIPSPEQARDDGKLYICLFPVSDQGTGYTDEDTESLELKTLKGKRAVFVGDVRFYGAEGFKRKGSFGFDAIVIQDHHKWADDFVERIPEQADARTFFINNHLLFEGIDTPDSYASGAFQSDLMREDGADWYDFVKALSLYADKYHLYFPVFMRDLTEASAEHINIAETLNLLGTYLFSWVPDDESIPEEGPLRDNMIREIKHRAMMDIIEIISSSSSFEELARGLEAFTRKIFGEDFTRWHAAIMEEVDDSIADFLASSDRIYFYRMKTEDNVMLLVHKIVFARLNATGEFKDRVFVHYYVAEDGQMSALLARGTDFRAIDVSDVCINGPDGRRWGGGHKDRAGFGANPEELREEVSGDSDVLGFVFGFIRDNLGAQYARYEEEGEPFDAGAAQRPSTRKVLVMVPAAETAEQSAIDDITPPSVGHVEPVADAYAALQAGGRDEAYDLLMQGLLGEDFVVNIETAIGILDVLIAHYGRDTEKEEELVTALNIVTRYRRSQDQTTMKEELRSLARRVAAAERTGRTIYDLRPGWTFRGWREAKEAVYKRFKPTDERKQALTLVRDLARRSAEQDLPANKILTMHLPQVLRAAGDRSIIKQFGGDIDTFTLFMGLALKMSEKGIDPSDMLEYGASAIARTARSGEELELFIDFGAQLVERGINPLDVFLRAIPELVKLTESPDELSSAIELSMRLAENGMNPSHSLERSAKAAKNMDELGLFMEFAIGLAENGIDPAPSMEHGISKVAEAAEDMDELRLLMDLGMKLAENKIEPVLTLIYAIPSMARAAQDNEELRLFIGLGTDLAESGIDPQMSLQHGIPAVVTSVKTRSDAEVFIRLAARLASEKKIDPAYILQEVAPVALEEIGDINRIEYAFNKILTLPSEAITLMTKQTMRDIAQALSRHGDFEIEHTSAGLRVLPPATALATKLESTVSLNELQQTVILFPGDGVMSNPEGFNQALDELTENNTVVVIADLKQGLIDFCIDHGIDIGRFFIRTPSEIGLAGFDMEQAMSLIAGIDNLRCVPLTDSLCDSYEALKKARDQV